MQRRSALGQPRTNGVRGCAKCRHQRSKSCCHAAEPSPPQYERRRIGVMGTLHHRAAPCQRRQPCGELTATEQQPAPPALPASRHGRTANAAEPADRRTRQQVQGPMSANRDARQRHRRRSQDNGVQQQPVAALWPQRHESRQRCSGHRERGDGVPRRKTVGVQGLADKRELGVIEHRGGSWNRRQLLDHGGSDAPYGNRRQQRRHRLRSPPQRQRQYEHDHAGVAERRGRPPEGWGQRRGVSVDGKEQAVLQRLVSQLNRAAVQDHDEHRCRKPSPGSAAPGDPSTRAPSRDVFGRGGAVQRTTRPAGAPTARGARVRVARLLAVIGAESSACDLDAP